MSGMLAMLSADGTLSCCYLGTDPALFGIPKSDARNIDYNEKHHEFQQLQRVIKGKSDGNPII